MSVYCTATQVEDHLPTGHGITSFADYIQWASGYVNAALQPAYYVMPDVTDDPPTPFAIQMLAARLAAWYVLSRIGVSNRFADESRVKALKEAVDEELRRYAANELTVPLETRSGKIITAWGTDPLGDQEFELEPDYEVLPNTVEISGYEYGTDYTVYYSQAHRAWILYRLDDDIKSQAEDAVNYATVSYEYSYRKKRELDLPASSVNGRIVRA